MIFSKRMAAVAVSAESANTRSEKKKEASHRTAPTRLASSVASPVDVESQPIMAIRFDKMRSDKMQRPGARLNRYVAGCFGDG